MKRFKILTLGVTFTSLIITSCAFDTSQEYFKSTNGNTNSQQQISQPSSFSSQKQQVEIKPVPDDLMAFYLELTTIGGSANSAIIPTTINQLYTIYKSDDEQMVTIAEHSEELTLIGEQKYHCYYAKKEIVDAVLERKKYPSAVGNIIPWRNLTAYITLYHSDTWQETFKSQPIMEAEISTDAKTISNIIGDYYLLDIVRLYDCSNETSENTCIDFVSFKTNDNEALISDNNKSDTIKYRWCKLQNVGSFFYDNGATTSKYQYLSNIEYVSFQIIEENGLETIKENFTYDG